MKKIYACFATDIIHEGHLNIISRAKEYGNLTVGVLRDEAMIKYDRFPILPFNERFNMIKNLDGVDETVIQETVSYDGVLDKVRPDYVIHGDDWLEYPRSVIRDGVIKKLHEWGGALMEIPYTHNLKTSKIDSLMRDRLAMPEYRRKRLRQLINLCRPTVKVIEAHNGISGLIAEKTIVEDNGELNQFDAMWVSSLCDSTAKGKPDIELVDISSRMRTLEEILDVTTKPVILDGDTGGQAEHFSYNVRTLERMGVSAVIIEDKIGLKRNSLFGAEANQAQDSIDNFCHKIKIGKNSLRTDEFMIIARIESLILERGMDDALERAFAYTEAGADGIMIHSRKKNPEEVFEFCDRFRDRNRVTPIVAVPSSYSQVTESELAGHGVNIVIYANHLTRSAFPAMRGTAETILKNHRAKETEPNILPINEIIKLIDKI